MLEKLFIAVLAGAILGVSGTFLFFQGRISKLEQRVNHHAEFKQDIENLRGILKQDIENLGSVLKQDIENIRSVLNQSLLEKAEGMTKEQFRETVLLMSEKRMLEKELFEKPAKSSENSFLKKFLQFFSSEEQTQIQSMAK